MLDQGTGAVKSADREDRAPIQGLAEETQHLIGESVERAHIDQGLMEAPAQPPPFIAIGQQTPHSHRGERHRLALPLLDGRAR